MDRPRRRGRGARRLGAGRLGIRRYDRQLSGPDRATQSHDSALARLAERLSRFPSERVVLVTHLPPWGLRLARDRQDIDRGNAQLRDLVDAFHPAAVISGHVHHRAVEIGRSGSTIVIVPGPYGHVLRLAAP